MKHSTTKLLAAGGIAATVGGSFLAVGNPVGEWILYLAGVLAILGLIPWGWKRSRSFLRRPKTKSPDEELAYEADKMADRLRGFLFSSRGARLLDNMALRDFVAINGNELHHLGKRIERRFPGSMSEGSLVPNSYEDVERTSKWLESVAELLREPKS